MSAPTPIITDRSYGIIALRYLPIICLSPDVTSPSPLPIPLKPTTSNTQILLIHQKTLRPSSEWTWCLPKGHAEPDDTSVVHTAIRELQEETSIIIGKEHVLNFGTSEEANEDTRFTETYVHPARRPGKEVKYWVALVPRQQGEKALQVQEKEVAGYKWCSWTEAKELIRFEEGKEVISRAGNALDRRGSFVAGINYRW